MNGAFDRLCATRVLDHPEREAASDRRRRAWVSRQQAGAGSGLSPPGAPPGPETDAASERFPPQASSGPDSSGASDRTPLASLPLPVIDEAAARLVARAGELAERARALRVNHFRATSTDTARRLRDLLVLEQELRRVLGQLLCELRARRAWRALRFDSLRHYAEARLGLSRSSVEDAALLARALPCYPLLREACEENRVSPAAALRVVRVLGLGREAVPVEIERYWTEHAATTTIKRLDDERGLLRERRLLRAGDPVAPVPDTDWHASLARVPGDSAARLRACTRLAAERRHDVVPLLLVLPFSRGADFLGALRSASRHVRTFSADLAPFDARWLGLVALLTSYVSVHDDHRGRAGVYARDGWRCMAPGCTSHANLEDHHVRYRSRDGDDAPENRVTLCRFHHQRGEHGSAMKVVGRAPLGLEFTLDGETYWNERRIGRPATRPQDVEPPVV
jgi:hypothetical protein